MVTFIGIRLFICFEVIWFILVIYFYVSFLVYLMFLYITYDDIVI